MPGIALNKGVVLKFHETGLPDVQILISKTAYSNAQRGKKCTVIATIKHVQQAKGFCFNNKISEIHSNGYLIVVHVLNEEIRRAEVNTL